MRNFMCKTCWTMMAVCTSPAQTIKPYYREIESFSDESISHFIWNLSEGNEKCPNPNPNPKLPRAQADITLYIQPIHIVAFHCF